MIAIYLHPPRHASDPPSYEIDSPGIVKWWDEQGTVGGYALIVASDLAKIIAGEGHEGLEAVLWAMEEAGMVRVDRRE